MSLQLCAIPVCMLAGTHRFLVYADFQVAYIHGVLIDFLFLTVPFLVVTIIAADQVGGLTVYTLTSLIVQLLASLMQLKHLFAAQNDEMRTCRFFDPRTCRSLRQRSDFCGCCADEEDQAMRMPDDIISIMVTNLELERAQSKAKAKAEAQASKDVLSFKEKHRLEALPAEIDRLDRDNAND